MIDINTLIESGITDFNITIKYSDLAMYTCTSISIRKNEV